MTNKEIAQIFYQIAELLEIEGKVSTFEINAYQNAARRIDYLDKDVNEIYEEGGVKGLKEIEGVGESLADHIEELLKTGRLKKLQNLIKKIPTIEYEISQISSVGAKTAQKLYRHLKPKSLADLKKKLGLTQAKKLLAKLEIKEKTIENILRGFAVKEKVGQRVLLYQAEEIAIEILNRLKNYPEVEKVEATGSLRRKKETIGDIDFALVSREPTETIEKFTNEDFVREVLTKGQIKASVITENGLQADIEIFDKQHWGSLLVHFTGSKEFNVAMREYSLKKGLSFSEYGFKKLKVESSKFKVITCPTEEKVFETLGLQYIPPELRENNGEIEAAEKKQIPSLVELKDIKGDLHLHTNVTTDANNDLEEMIKMAIELKYDYLGVSSHTQKLTFIGGLDDKQLLKYKNEFDKLKNKYQNRIKLFFGAEVNIDKDGNIDLKEETLKRLDYVVGSIHSFSGHSIKENTTRIINAIKNPYINIIGHPTGRKFGEREAMDCDWEEVFQACVKYRTALEVNGQPQRMDLLSNLCQSAKQTGVKFFVGSDAHSTEGLVLMEYGVAVARRGWLTKKDILNTMDRRDVEKFFHNIKN